MKLQLPSVTLICIDCENAFRAIAVLEHCKSLCDFGSVRFLTSEQTDYPHDVIKKIGSGDRVMGLVEYSDFVLRHIYEYVDTSHMLIVQHDGWVLKPQSWDNAWLCYDYMGPLFIQRPDVGSGGFSLRSRRFMETVSQILPPFGKGCYGSTGYAFEDGVIAFGLRSNMEGRGFRFAPKEVAAKFAYGGNPCCATPESFGFHGFYALDWILGGPGDPIARAPNGTIL